MVKIIQHWLLVGNRTQTDDISITQPSVPNSSAFGISSVHWNKKTQICQNDKPFLFQTSSISFIFFCICFFCLQSPGQPPPVGPQWVCRVLLQNHHVLHPGTVHTHWQKLPTASISTVCQVLKYFISVTLKACHWSSRRTVSPALLFPLDLAPAPVNHLDGLSSSLGLEVSGVHEASTGRRRRQLITASRSLIFPAQLQQLVLLLVLWGII